MTNYYVKTQGNDNNAGTSTELALQTIQKAITLAGDGDTIYVAPGTYREVLSFTKVNSASSRINIIGDEECTIFTEMEKGEVLLDGSSDGKAMLETAFRFETNNAGRYIIKNLKVRNYVSKIVSHDNTASGIDLGRNKSGAFVRKTTTSGTQFTFVNCEFSGGTVSENETGVSDTHCYSMGCFNIRVNYDEKLAFNNCVVKDNVFVSTKSILSFAALLYAYGPGISTIEFNKCDISNTIGKSYLSTSSQVYTWLSKFSIIHTGLFVHTEVDYPISLIFRDSQIDLNQPQNGSGSMSLFKTCGVTSKTNSTTYPTTSNYTRSTTIFERSKINRGGEAHYLFSSAGNVIAKDSSFVSSISTIMFYSVQQGDSTFDLTNCYIESNGVLFNSSVHMGVDGNFKNCIFKMNNTSNVLFHFGSYTVDLDFQECMFIGGTYQVHVYTGSSSSAFYTSRISILNSLMYNAKNGFLYQGSCAGITTSENTYMYTPGFIHDNNAGVNYHWHSANRWIGVTTTTYGINTNGDNSGRRPASAKEIPSIVLQELENPIEGKSSLKIPVAPVGAGTLQILLEENKEYDIVLQAKKDFTGSSTKMDFCLCDTKVSGKDTTELQDIVLRVKAPYSGFYDLEVFGDNGVTAYSADGFALNAILIDSIQIAEV